MTPSHLESLIVVLKAHDKHSEEAFAYPENANRMWTEDIEELISRGASEAEATANSAAYLHLNLSLRPKNLMKGYVFGSDPNTCDVLIEKSRTTGISGNHFSIQIDWTFGNAKIACFSGNNIKLKEERTRRFIRNLSRNDSEVIVPGLTLLVEVTDRFNLSISCPNRGSSQQAYDKNLREYHQRYLDAVPRQRNISLDQPDMTPFALGRCVGLNGGEYYTTQRLTTGDTDYDLRVYLFSANARSPVHQVGSNTSPLAADPPQDVVPGSDTTTESLFSDPNTRVYVMKYFRNKAGLCHIPTEKAKRWSQLEHLNILRTFDFIVKGREFLVVNEAFLHITLDSILREGPTLVPGESGFVMGQVFDGLDYLHEQGWVHGNLDPRSILVAAKDPLLVKLADFALCGMVYLGKPEGYHDRYASQMTKSVNARDIWSAGVVGLHLLHGRLPEPTPYTSATHGRYVQQLETYVKGLSRSERDNNGLSFLTRVMKTKPEERPTAKELREDPWIESTRQYKVPQLPVSPLATPQRSYRASVEPPKPFHGQISGGPSNRPIVGDHASNTSLKTSHQFNRQNSADPSMPVIHGRYASELDHVRGESSSSTPVSYARYASEPDHMGGESSRKGPFNDVSRYYLSHPMLGTHPCLGDNCQELDDEYEAIGSRQSHFTVNTSSRTPHASTKEDSKGKLNVSGGPGTWGRSLGE